MIAGALIGLTLGALTLAAPRPDPQWLFACPTDAARAALAPRAKWQAVSLGDGAMAVRVPPKWRIKRDAGKSRIASTSGRTVIRARVHRSGTADEIFDDVIHRTLGPSHLNDACHRRWVEALIGATQIATLRTSISARRLGERSRSAVVVAGFQGGVLELIVTMEWPSSAAGPDMMLLGGILGSLHFTR